MIRGFATLGIIGLIAIVDGFIGGIAAAHWGDAWGCRLDDLALYGAAFYGISRWIDQHIKREGIRA